MVTKLSLKKKQTGGVVFIMPLLQALRVFLQIVIKKLFIKKPLGLLNPLSATFFTLSIPITLIILTIHNKKIKELTQKYLNIDIYKSKSYFNKESLRELSVVYASYFILSQIFLVILLNPSSKRRIFRGKFTSLSIIDIPRSFFDIFSLIIIPRIASNAIENNIYFQFDKNKKISAQILYYTAILGIIGLNNVWNYPNLIFSFFLTIIIIILIENNFRLFYPAFNFKKKFHMQKVAYKDIFFNLFGFEFPNREYKLDYLKVCFFLSVFVFIMVSTYSKYIPFYNDLIGSELHILEIIIKIYFCIWLPIKFKNIAKGTNYETEMFLLGNLLSLFIPILFREIIGYFYDGIGFISDGIDMAEEAIDNIDLDLDLDLDLDMMKNGDY